MLTTFFKEEHEMFRRSFRDFVEKVQSPELLRMLLVLTVADIRAVGPGAWNAWKAQLLRDLYYEAESLMTGAATCVWLTTKAGWR